MIERLYFIAMAGLSSKWKYKSESGRFIVTCHQITLESIRFLINFLCDVGKLSSLNYKSKNITQYSQSCISGSSTGW